VFAVYAQTLIKERIDILIPPTSPIPGSVPRQTPAEFFAALESKGRSKKFVPIGNDTVGIIGAGIGGLYAAVILKSLGIPYVILEGSNRVGGRVFTHRFRGQGDPDVHNYFVGISLHIFLWPNLYPAFSGRWGDAFS
jgi:hypothetical protein